MIVSSGLMFLPTSLALDDEHDVASSDEELISPLSTGAGADAENVSPSDTNEITRDLALQAQREVPARVRPITRGVIKPLIAFATAQYVIVAALVAGVAVTVAHHASHVINEKFAPIVDALKRF